ncbi:nucleoside-diphosphate kinase [Companilactobacillus sp. RD055328]|uniref:nucleoside-diphosphate kinase n=1 Tax=Companilactobacillus sp. RD055328 TaxID=2916634 RepID=UPI001FC7CC23|nr:nucleoside-diphosphate kinase [Companilactobacillus sp. RD055328]GKQ42959.1 nucleoside-diphosphate kinase [Companilactobacillus sp. RD055328]
MSEERTLILIKPDGVSQGHVGDIITRIENKRYTIEQLKVINVTEDELRNHYIDKIDKPYFPDMMKYMQEGPIVAMVISGTNVIKAMRQMAGATMPDEALPGTIRGDFGRSWNAGATKNVVHSSDSVESAEREIAIWFK